MQSRNQEAQARRSALGLGLRYGLLIGLGLALGTWGIHILSLITVPTRLLFGPVLLGATGCLLLGGLAGWLSALLRSSLGGAIVWTATGVLIALVINHVPYEGYNLVAWSSDRAFWGLPIRSFDDPAQVRLWLSGFFIVLLLAILGLLQDYRLEGLGAGLKDGGRLDPSTWIALALPLPLVLAAGVIADNIVNSPLRAPQRAVDAAVRTVRTYSGDIFALSLERGVNYNAMSPVREQLGGDFTLSIGEADLGEAERVTVVAEFESGAWIYCQVVAGNLTNCYDASPPYLQGFPTLLATGELPEDCPACRFRVGDGLRAWLGARRASLSEAPQITRLGQEGSYVLMRAAAAPPGDFAIECRFHGIAPIYLEDCWQTQGPEVALAPTSAGETPTAAAQAIPSASATPTPEPSPIGTSTQSPSPPSTSTPTTSTAPQPSAAPSSTRSRAPYATAMRPAFLADLDAIGPLTTYSITVAIDPESATLEGRQTVHYVNGSSSDQERVYFRLFPNLPGYGGTMSVGNLYVQRVDGLAGQPEEGELTAEGTALRVPLGEPLVPGEGVTLTMDFATSVPTSVDRGYGQFIYQADVMALANFFPLIPAYDEENCARFGNCDGGWNIEVAVPYGDAVFSPTALFDVRVIAPTDWTVVASGSTLEQRAGPGEMRTWNIVSGPMRDFTLVLSPRFEVATAKVDDVLVNSYYLPGDRAGGERVLRWSAAALAFFNQQFGPYPFAELDVAATSTLAGGIEYPGLIVLPIRRYDQIDGVFQWSTVHEVAHQWWYSLVGNDQQDEPWLDEALTQYSTALFYELHEGWDEAVSEVLEARYQVVAGTPEDDLISRPVAAYTESNYGPVVYGKGPLFFDALRQRLGGDLFSEILRAYFKTYRYGIADGMDLLSVITSLSDQDLSELYQEWLGDQAGAGL